jgi:hypothetical protein
VLLVAAIGAASGCAFQRATGDPSYDPAVITQAELDSCHAASAFDAVSKLRPMFLQSRGKLDVAPGTLPAMPRVYVDDQYYGEAGTLREIPSSSILSIRFYTAAEAQYKFGRGNEAGVINIFTKH